ncbi:cytochrome d ubiquinol oxidase subunit II [Nafulsella turpanensis]|uniref:cytochrome d ubiquinol oxidase subunit II n=1 Tax=Nafulsella turpanensis TaxID=1265690 RepID=UPI0003471519|nr:cytochrome d ubiquinol oxidase subunit II [Nafulsella turpanensis]
MLFFVILFLALSLLAYVLFGGADFGAGIIEIFAGNKTRKTITHAIAPVWEANHIWLILVVVILFMGFPLIYAQVSLYLHIPLVVLLLGIVLRGTAFTFRHYDAVIDRSQNYYSFIFKLSSVISPFFLGVIMGALILGKIPLEPGSFYDAFMAPWLNWFCFVLGIFTCCLFAFLAAVYLIGEAEDQVIRKHFLRMARNANLATVVAGGFVFLSAEVSGYSLATQFLQSTPAIVAMVLATLSLPVLWWSLLREQLILPRFLAGFQATAILGAWFWVQYPVVIRYADGSYLGLLDTAAPFPTIRQLALALIVGSLLILPALYFLMKTFKAREALMDREV